MNKGINMEKIQEKIPEYENNETAPNFCNNFWTKTTQEDTFYWLTHLWKLADQSVQNTQLSNEPRREES